MYVDRLGGSCPSEVIPENVSKCGVRICYTASNCSETEWSLLLSPARSPIL